MLQGQCKKWKSHYLCQTLFDSLCLKQNTRSWKCHSCKKLWNGPGDFISSVLQQAPKLLQDLQSQWWEGTVTTAFKPEVICNNGSALKNISVPSLHHSVSCNVGLKEKICIALCILFFHVKQHTGLGTSQATREPINTRLLFFGV